MEKTSKTMKVFNYMKTFGSISGREAFNTLGLYRLSSSIHELREMGVNIVTDMVCDERNGEKVRYGRYYLSPDNQVDPTHKEEQSAYGKVS